MQKLIFAQSIQINEQSVQTNEQSEQTQTKAVSCPGCGANNIVSATSRVCECEYCGTSINIQ